MFLFYNRRTRSTRFLYGFAMDSAPCALQRSSMLAWYGIGDNERTQALSCQATKEERT